MPFRQFGAVGAVDQRDVCEFGHRPVERTIDLRLAERVAEMVVAADHVGNFHVVIVDHDREIVRGRAIGAQNDQIVEFSIVDRDLALDEVVDRRRTLLWRPGLITGATPGGASARSRSRRELSIRTGRFSSRAFARIASSSAGVQ